MYKIIFKKTDKTILFETLGDLCEFLEAKKLSPYKEELIMGHSIIYYV